MFLPGSLEGSRRRNGLCCLTISEKSRYRKELIPWPARLWSSAAKSWPAKPFEDPSKVSKRPLVRFQKGLLTSVGEGAMEISTTGHAAHAKHVGLLSFAGDVRIRFIPVHLGFFSPMIGLRNKQLLADQP